MHIDLNYDPEHIFILGLKLSLVFFCCAPASYIKVLNCVTFVQVFMVTSCSGPFLFFDERKPEFLLVSHPDLRRSAVL